MVSYGNMETLSFDLIEQTNVVTVSCWMHATLKALSVDLPITSSRNSRCNLFHHQQHGVTNQRRSNILYDSTVIVFCYFYVNKPYYSSFTPSGT